MVQFETVPLNLCGNKIGFHLRGTLEARIGSLKESFQRKDECPFRAHSVFQGTKQRWSWWREREREGGRRGAISGCVHTRLGPRDMHALAWSRISIDIARVRSGSVNPDASRPRCLRRCIAKGTSEEWKVAPPRALENASIASFPIRGERAFRLASSVCSPFASNRFWRGSINVREM